MHVVKRSALISVLCILGWAQAGLATTLKFTVNYAVGSGPTAMQQDAMNTAVDIWEYLVTGYVETPTSLGTPPLQIDASFSNIDGAGGILGSAAPREIRRSPSRNELYTHKGEMTFDTSDIGSYSFASLTALFLHEMAHIIGFGSLWDLGPYDLTDISPGQSTAEATIYTGAEAIAAYNSETGLAATSVPLEEAGPLGTKGVHWDENTNGANPGSTFFGFELMSGWLNLGPDVFISETTVGSFRDIGYTTRAGYEASTVDQLITAVSSDAVAPVPLPAGGWLALSGLLFLRLASRRDPCAQV